MKKNVIVFKKESIKCHLEDMAQVLIDVIGRDLMGGDLDLEHELIAAYNRMKEDEFDGAGYVFDLSNNEDVKYLISHDILSFKELCVFNENFESGLLYLEDGVWRECNDLKRFLEGWLGFVVRAMLIYPHVAEYNVIYSRYVSDVCGGTDFFK